MKKCNHCKQVKSYKEFYTQKRSSGRYGLRYVCKLCDKQLTFKIDEMREERRSGIDRRKNENNR